MKFKFQKSKEKFYIYMLLLETIKFYIIKQSVINLFTFIK